MRTLVIVAVVAALVLGCQQSRPTNPLAPPMGPAVRTLKEEGDQLARSHDWAGAATRYQTALNRESSNLELRLAFGSMLSHVDGGLRTASASPATDAASAGKEATPKGDVRGMTSWPGVAPRERLVPLRITLSGEDTENRDVQLGRRFRLGEPYRLADARPGKYRLRAVAIDQNLELWDKQVVVEAGKETALDLSASDSSVSPREFSPAN